MPSIVGKSILHEEKLTLLNKEPSLRKRYCRKGRKILVKETDTVPRVCFVARMRVNIHS